MTDTLSRIDEKYGFTTDEIAREVANLRARQRAWQLKELRKSAGLTQSQVAEMLQVRQNRVSQIEHGDLATARLDTLRKYMGALGGKLNVELELGDIKYQLA